MTENVDAFIDEIVDEEEEFEDMTEYELEAISFLKRAQTEMRVAREGRVIGFPNTDDKMVHDKYIVKLTRRGREYSFPFYQSARDTELGIAPNAYDVLSCVQKYPADDFETFIWEYGYDTGDEESLHNAREIWKACKDQFENLMDLFGEPLMRELANIQ